jgi:hypothetical protein
LSGLERKRCFFSISIISTSTNPSPNAAYFGVGGSLRMPKSHLRWQADGLQPKKAAAIQEKTRYAVFD